MRYFARTTAGLEEITWLEISSRLHEARLIHLTHRQICFDYDGFPAQLLDLRIVDDIFVYVATVPGIGHTHASLDKLRLHIAQLQFGDALGIVQTVRSLGKPISFYITASYLGSRNFSRHDIAEAAKAGLLKRYTWTPAESSDLAQVDVRLLLEGTEATVGIRLQSWPLHRRNYKVCSIRGSLKPPVAYCLSRLASVQADDAILDPFSGAGTIGLEIAETLCQGKVMNSDISSEACGCAITNCAAANALLSPTFWIADAARMPLQSNSVTSIISNLPWGRKVQVNRELAELYALAMGEIERVLRPRGRAVLLTDRSDLLLQNAGNLQLAFAKQISLYGQYPTIHVLDYRPRDSTPPFPATSAFGMGLNGLIERDGRRQPYRPLSGKVPG